MADANIQLSSLPSTVAANNSDLMLLRQGTEDKKATIQVIKDRILNGRDYTATEILDLLKTVDGAGSGLDADNLDGQQGAFYQNASNLNDGTIPQARLNASDILALLLTVDGPGSGLNADFIDGASLDFLKDGSSIQTGTISQSVLPPATTGQKGIIERATQAETNNGTDNERAVTPLTLAGAMNSLTGITASAGNNGRLIVPYSASNGIMFQWGSVTLSGNTGSTLSFPEPFTDVYQAFVTSTENSTNADAPTNPLLTNTQIRVINGAGGTATIRWVAIGRKSI